MSAIVYKGDALDILPTLAPGSIDAVVTSPPYAMQRAAEYGGTTEEEWPQWFLEWMNALHHTLSESASIAIVVRPHVRHGVLSDYVLRTRMMLRDAGWCELDEWIWDKKGGAPFGDNKRPRRSWEHILWYAATPRPWIDPRGNGKWSTRIGTPYGNLFTNNERFAKKQGHRVRPESAGIARGSDLASISTGVNGKGELAHHPAPFPPALAGWIIRYLCPPGGTVLDPFSGSGSTGIAALRERRNYVGIELHSEFAEKSRQRLASEPDILPETG